MSYIKLNNLHITLPDGRELFCGINKTFSGKSSVIGVNGTGKSVLAKAIDHILNGADAHGLTISGEITGDTKVFYLPQFKEPRFKEEVFLTAADAIGISDKLNAIKRVESGSTNPEDYDIIGDNWLIREEAEQLMRDFEINGTPESEYLPLSGGEKVKLNLIRAFASGADFLILDEPTNHLDKAAKDMLYSKLRTVPSYIVISHDRELLEQVDNTVLLENSNLISYGGGWSFFEAERKAEHERTINEHAAQKSILKSAEKELQNKEDGLAKKSANAKKNRDKAGLPKIVLGMMKEQNEKSSARISGVWSGRVDEIRQKEQELFDKINRYNVDFKLPEIDIPQGKMVLELTDLVLPYVNNPPLNYIMKGAERVRIDGKNGSGKTTLLKVITGQINAVSGRYKLGTDYMLLEQNSADRLSDDKRTVLVCMRDAHPALAEHLIRESLINVNILKTGWDTPIANLSGGERLKVLILERLLSDNPPQLMILDEPTNHLDVDSAKSLENMLRSYKGALFIISHDAVFIDNIDITATVSIN